MSAAAVASPTLEPAIVVDHLKKVFRQVNPWLAILRGRVFGKSIVPLDDVSFIVRPGEVVCFMGPNGAGKSTLLRVLAGLLTPTKGSVHVMGLDVRNVGDAFRRRVAFMVPEERSFNWRLSARENMYFYAALHGYDTKGGRARSEELIHRVGLGDAIDRPYREYSRGMRQRLAIARGLLGDPRVLLLDEPTLGLDPVGARDLRRFLRTEMITGAGRTAVVGSNDPLEVRAIADRVIFLEKGHLRGESKPADVNVELGLDDRA